MVVRMDGTHAQKASAIYNVAGWLSVPSAKIYQKSYAELPQQGMKFSQLMDHHYADSLLLTGHAFLSENEELTSHAYPQLCPSS